MRFKSFAVATFVFFSLVSFSHAALTVTRTSETEIPGLPGPARMFMPDGPIVVIEAVDGNVKATVTGEGKKQTITLVELFKNAAGKDDARIYTITRGGRNCRVQTLDEFKETFAMLGEGGPFKMGGPADKPEHDVEEYEFTHSCEDTGKLIDANGKRLAETRCVLIAKKKGQTLESGGGTEIISSMAFDTVPGWEEMLAFDKRYGNLMAEAIGITGGLKGLMAMLTRAPGLEEGLEIIDEKIMERGETAVITDVEVKYHPDPNVPQQNAEMEEEDSGGPSIGKFASKFLKKRKAKRDAKKAAEKSAQGASTFMKMKSAMTGANQNPSPYTKIPTDCKSSR